MKKCKFLITLVLTITTFSLVSQKDSSGIYFSPGDYYKHKLSFSINCKSQKHKIKTDVIFHSKEISVKHNDTIHKFHKDSIYAIKYCDGSIERIYNNEKYYLVNPDEIIMIYKITSGAGMKGSPIEINYFFSTDASAKIVRLSIYNMKAAFPNNHKFHDLIDMEFRNDEDLIIFDSFHKMMKINRVLINSKSNN